MQEHNHYPLPEDDVEFLHSNHHNVWKQVVEENKRGLVISNYKLPSGYTLGEADLMLLIPADYPMVAIDMFYFSPDLVRADSFPIEALNPEAHFGQQWQRWSRHYQWRPGIDSIATHIIYVGNELKAELEKRI